MKYLSLIAFFVLLSSFVAAQDVMSATINYNAGQISLTDIVVGPGYVSGVSGEGAYTIQVRDSFDKVLHSENFNIDRTLYATPPEEGWFDERGNQVIFPSDDELAHVSSELDEVDVELLIPVFSEGRSLLIFEGDKLLDAASIASFAETCGDNICDGHESYASCSLDCSSGSLDDYCDAVQDDICDPDCSAREDSDCSEFASNIAVSNQLDSSQVPQAPATDPVATQVADSDSELTSLFIVLSGIIVIVVTVVLTVAKIKRLNEKEM